MIVYYKFFWWQREGKALPKAALPFNRAMPSITHMALVELEKASFLKFVISQVCFSKLLYVYAYGAHIVYYSFLVDRMHLSILVLVSYSL